MKKGLLSTVGEQIYHLARRRWHLDAIASYQTGEWRGLPMAETMVKYHNKVMDREEAERREIANDLRQMRRESGHAYTRIVWTGRKAWVSENRDEMPAVVSLRAGNKAGTVWWAKQVLRRIQEQIRKEQHRRVSLKEIDDAEDTAIDAWINRVSAMLLRDELHGDEEDDDNDS